MAKWYVKQLSALTGVSVQTLHHYDHIGLLKPSIRLTNGYRLYSEKDLLRLQQIIALKFFGFPLNHIKKILTFEVDVFDSLKAQSAFLSEKAESLKKASKLLDEITAECKKSKSIKWQKIIDMMEVYNMTKDIGGSWLTKVLSPEELKQYAQFKEGLKERFTEKEHKEFEQNWKKLIENIKHNLDKDPESAFGKDMGRQFMNMVNSLYGKKYANLKNAVWEKGFKKGKADEHHLMTPDIIEWLDKAIDEYYTDRFETVFKQAPSKQSDEELEDLLSELYGNDKMARKQMLEECLGNPSLNQQQKDWLKGFL